MFDLWETWARLPVSGTLGFSISDISPGLNTRTACPGIVATRDPESGRWDVAAACRVELRFS